MDVVQKLLHSVACYFPQYHDSCQNEADAPLVIVAVVILVILVIVGWFLKPYIARLSEAKAAHEELADLIPVMLEIITYADVNRVELADMSPKELQFQMQYWEGLLRHAKSVKELLEIRDSLIKEFIPAPEVAWRFSY